MFVFKQFFERRILHQVGVYFGRSPHVNQGDFIFLAPVVIADKERAHLVFSVFDGVCDCMVQVEECRFRADLYLAPKVVGFV